MKYYLSNRQEKELTNGKTIRIAIPVVGHLREEFGEMMEYAREMLIPAGCAAKMAIERWWTKG